MAPTTVKASIAGGFFLSARPSYWYAIAKRYVCDFVDDNGDIRSIAVALNRREIEAARYAAHPAIEAQARALRHGYRAAPTTWRHVAHGVTAQWNC
jgi:hypothetical protein